MAQSSVHMAHIQPFAIKLNSSKLKDRLNVSLLVSGFSRKFCPVPDRISGTTLDIIHQFLPQTNGNVLPNFVWDVDPTFSSPSLSSFDSDTFDVGLPNVFFLRLQSLSVFKSGVNQPISSSSSPSFGGPTAFNHSMPPSLPHTTNTNHFFGSSSVAGFGSNTSGFGAFSGLSTTTNVGHKAAEKRKSNDRFVLSLMTFPAPFQVISHFELYCLEIGMHFAGIWNMSHQQSVIQNTPTRIEMNMYNHNGFGGHTASANMKLVAASWLLPADDIGDLLSESGLTFECRLNVLRVLPNGFSSGFGGLSTIDSLPSSSYIYECSERVTLSPIRMSWRISGSEISKMHSQIQQEVIPMNAVQINSNVFGGMFQLKLWMNATTSTVSLWITLCGLPRGTAKVGVKFEISARDSTKGGHVQIISEIITFSYGAAVHPLTEHQNVILRRFVSEEKGLSLHCRATIIQRLDDRNNVVVQSTPKKKEKRLVDDISKRGFGNTQRVDRPLTVAKEEFLEMDREDFVWKIRGEESMRDLRALNVDDQYLSDPFTLFGLKWYLSVQAGNSSTRTAGWSNSGAWMASAFVRNTQSQHSCDTLAVYLNPLLPSRTFFDCRVSIRILQTDCRCHYYCRYQGISKDTMSLGSSCSSIRQQTDYVMQSIAALKGMEEIDILVSMEKVNEAQLNQPTTLGNNGAELSYGLRLKDDPKYALSKEVGLWLSDTVKLPEYGELFARHGVDELDIIKQLTLPDLKAMGICRVGHLIRINKGIQALRTSEEIY